MRFKNSGEKLCRSCSSTSREVRSLSLPPHSEWPCAKPSALRSKKYRAPMLEVMMMTAFWKLALRP